MSFNLAQTRQTIRFNCNRRGQMAFGNRYMYCPVATKCRAEFIPRQRRRHRDISSADKARTLVDAAIRCLDNQPSTPGYKPFAGFLETRHRLPGSPCEAQQFNNSP